MDLVDRVAKRAADKTAAKMDLYSKWRDIIDKHNKAEQRDLQALLKESVKYFKSVGYDLDLRRSSIGKYYSGSDGVRLEGVLFITERPENTVQAEDARTVEKWVNDAIDMHGSARRNSDGSWMVDITES